MTSTPSDLHSAWARWFISALADSGLRDVIISPGSRSTPLALAAAGSPRVRCLPVVDERAAAFVVLGQARITGRASMLLCTSGTAGAHYLPALIEAAQAFVPVLVVTTDRPWEAYDCASPQTIDQTDLFGRVVRHRAELGLPDASPEALAAVGRIAAQALALTRAPTPGPVHVNARFRKPLEPVAVAAPEPWSAGLSRLVALGAPRTFTQECIPSADGVAALTDRLAHARRPLFVCGPTLTWGGAASEALFALAAAVGAPVVAESSSGYRHVESSGGAVVVPGLDLAARSERWRAAHPPDVVVAWSLPPTSPALTAWITQPEVERWVVAPQGWSDPTGDARALLWGEPEAVAHAVLRSLGARPVAADPAWSAALAKADAAAWSAVREETFGEALDELTVAQALVDALPAGSCLVAGNSMPVRDLELASPWRALRVLHQRGGSGIDGLVAGAVGARTKHPPAEPVAVLLGDVSAAHDLGGLAAAQELDGALVVLLVQNEGGRIFAELPLGRAAPPGSAGAGVFARFFLTPQGIRWGEASAAFGHRYARVDTPAALSEALDEAVETSGVTVIEAVVPPEDAGARRQRVRARVERELTA
ncbi:MAG: 2-succinyl-5-enolpyruvyl-6-hydroxy-3-cyclohexene-1-carboxylic-acid synthase [Deltaproteobacteria bacterium]|nr:2-succinyl-5-enolpyruvyl-6-hydroxy-3-cyclohexene-1-carboxylic-acid synthase [Myxococcales bacterium]MDP3221333.1 2-succinyl-5-enolpyruvyl-6-hydroxy-3-cyclohexene-1-carboxylic-acid synthase [Deltaproteobacteria bacterium]